MRMWKTLTFAVAAVMLLAARPAAAFDPENTLILELAWGTVVIEMHPDMAPRHVARIKELVRKGFYDGTVFHRVIPKFMAQAGDPTGTGEGGSGQKIAAEFNGDTFTRGAVGMARTSQINSADSQFFIMLGTATHLDGKYTNWGRVIEGMDNVDKITKGEGDGGVVSVPDKIVRMRVAADVK